MRSIVVLLSLAAVACDGPALPQFGPRGLQGFGPEDAGPSNAALLYGSLGVGSHVVVTTPPPASTDAGAPSSDPPPATSSDPPATSSDPPPASDPPAAAGPPTIDLAVCMRGTASYESLTFTKATGGDASIVGSWTAYDSAGNAIATGDCPAASVADGATYGSMSCSAFLYGASRIVYVFHGTNVLSLSPDVPPSC